MVTSVAPLGLKSVKHGFTKEVVASSAGTVHHKVVLCRRSASVRFVSFSPHKLEVSLSSANRLPAPRNTFHKPMSPKLQGLSPFSSFSFSKLTGLFFRRVALSCGTRASAALPFSGRVLGNSAPRVWGVFSDTNNRQESWAMACWHALGSEANFLK